jgi:hypothetical protein
VEYYKANLALSDKKKWLLDPKNKSAELLDPANLKIMGITKEQAMENNNLFKRAILPEVFISTNGKIGNKGSQKAGELFCVLQ